MSDTQPSPAPWMLRGRGWTFLLPGLSKTASFPSGFSAPHEAEVLASGGEFIGGMGLIMIIAYSESPVGPYDELLYIPGRWKYPDGRIGFRVTRIYVSSKASTENGRRNWNIPKQVAAFDIDTSNGSTRITVTHPGASSPFFKAKIKPMFLLSSVSVPFSSGVLGKYCTVIQPPVPAGERPEEVATNEWASVVPDMKGKVSLAVIMSEPEGRTYGDGVGFPAITPWTLGLYMEDSVLNFEVSTTNNPLH